MYILTYHTDILKDIAGLGAADKHRIKSAIDSKLVIDPVRFGKPLQHSLRGLRSLRVGNYRVVFLLKAKEVFVVLIAHRSIVYERVGKRL